MFNTRDKKFAQLSNGQKIPRIGYGTYESQGSLEVPLKQAIKAGFRHFDTASAYGNEEIIGKVLKEAINNGTVKREELFVTTKIWVDQKDDVEKAVKESLERLQLDYIDLYIIHFPIGEVDTTTGKVKKQVPLHVTWKAMEAEVKAGRVKSIGVSNFNVQLLLDLLSYAEIRPVCNQIEVHPYLSQEDLIGFCKKNDIEVIAFSPLGGNSPTEPQYTAKTLLEDPIIQRLAKKYNKTPGQILLNWHLSRGYSIIPKTATESRMKENLESDTFELLAEDVKKINALNKNIRLYDPKGFPFMGGIPLYA